MHEPPSAIWRSCLSTTTAQAPHVQQVPRCEDRSSTHYPVRLHFPALCLNELRIIHFAYYKDTAQHLPRQGTNLQNVQTTVNPQRTNGGTQIPQKNTEQDGAAALPPKPAPADRRSKAKLAAQPECANSIPMVWCRSRANSSASRQTVCTGGLVGVRRDPLFAVSDEQCTSCSDSPMFSGPEDPGNEDIGGLPMLKDHIPDLSSSFAPIAVMNVAGPEVWGCDTISDLDIDPGMLFDFHFNHGMEPVPQPPMNTLDCGNAVVDSPRGPRADQYELPACASQSNTFDSHGVSNSGVDMLKDLFTATTEAQRHLCAMEGCATQTASSNNHQRDDGSQTNEPWLSTKTPIAQILDALLSRCAGLTDTPLPEVVERQSNCGRRLPRVIASVRCALQEWRDREQDGFPLD